MQTGDGLLARVRVAGARLTPADLAALAKLADEHGNGLIDITARGNLQVRGLRPDTAPAFAEAVAALLPIETGLAIDISPIAGDDPEEIADPRPLADAIGKGAAGMAERLGPKVSVVIDGGGQISLSQLKADIRLRAQPGNSWAVTLGGGKPQHMDAQGVVATALALLGALAAIGPEARATDLFPVRDQVSSPESPEASRVLVHWRPRLNLVQGHSRAIALPFGAARSAEIIALCDAAMASKLTRMRLAPEHILLLDNAPDTLIAQAAEIGFITKADDSRTRVSACIGSRGCTSGHIAARDLAVQLAPRLPAGQTLHVSGCAKGCAHPRASDVTLVGQADGIGLVFGGRAGDTPSKFLDAAALGAGAFPFQGGR
ncbi:MAG: precorrin-3B synthase [Devosia indica]